MVSVLSDCPWEAVAPVGERSDIPNIMVGHDYGAIDASILIKLYVWTKAIALIDHIQYWL